MACQCHSHAWAAVIILSDVSWVVGGHCARGAMRERWRALTALIHTTQPSVAR